MRRDDIHIEEFNVIAHSEVRGGPVLYESWKQNNVTHRPRGQPAEVIYAPDGTLKHQVFYQQGMRHREEGPAWVTFDAAGCIINEKWYLRDQLSRPGDQPAVISRDVRSGAITKAAFWVDGLLHRPEEKGPAAIMRNPKSGIKVQEDWFTNGYASRTLGPAMIRRDPITGVVWREDWLLEGARARENGLPALILRDNRTGQVTKMIWFENGDITKSLAAGDEAFEEHLHEFGPR